MQSSEKNYAISDLPFYWRVKEAPHEQFNGVPQNLDFTFGINSNLGLVKQIDNASLWDYLRKIYSENANIGCIQESNLLATPYASDLLRKIEELKDTFLDIKFDATLEIGCGGCLVLEKIKTWCPHVLGLDPSPFAKHAGIKRGIEVVTDFFPSNKISGQFDLIFHADVLEHTPDPVDFLRSHHDYLNQNGVLLIAVPDCTENIQLGDPSMILHQHISYFSQSSLRKVIEAAGFNVLNIERAKYGGSLYATAQISAGQPSLNHSSSYEGDDESFLNRLENIHPMICNFISERIQKMGNDIGFYAPLRTFPYLSSSQFEYPFRIFDDTENLMHKYFDGIPKKIENFEDLRNEPLKEVYVMSLTFGDKIADRIKLAMPNTKVVTLRELLTKPIK